MLLILVQRKSWYGYINIKNNVFTVNFYNAKKKNYKSVIPMKHLDLKD